MGKSNYKVQKIGYKTYSSPRKLKIHISKQTFEKPLSLKFK